ncbi:MAG TPA: class I lanthipeptide [Frankiaceae bacterium]|nr:class I lanthipeptide [Frankiaceae bacterium]
MRKLSLRKESLAELSTDELAVVVGGAETKVCVTDPCITPPVSQLKCSFSIAAEVCG